VPLQLANGAALQNIEIRLPRGSAIAGHVYDENGEPAPATMVQVMRFQYQNGDRRLVPAGNAQTNDRGEFRVWGLNPGDYYVSAQLPNFGGIINDVVAGFGDIAGRGGRGGGPGGPNSPPPGGPGGGRAGRGAVNIDLNGVMTAATQALGQLQFLGADSAGLNALLGGQDTSEQIAYAPTYYPGVSSPAEARPISVALSGEALGIDFSLLLVRLSNVSGRVVNPDGSVATVGNATLVAEGLGRGGPFGNYSGRVVREGTFAIRNVPPGRYTLRVRSQSAPQPQPGQDAAADANGRGRGNGGGGRGRGNAGNAPPAYFGSQALTIAGDISDLTVALTPGATITGSVALELSRAASSAANGQGNGQPNVTQVRINTQPAEQSIGNSGQMAVQADGTFTLENVPPGLHWLRTQAPRGLSVKSIVVHGHDVTDSQIEVRGGDTLSDVVVTFTDKVTEINGTITDSKSAPVTDFTVLAFPQDADLWRPQARQIMTARPDQTGKYYLRGLPPGRYYLVTIDPTTPGEYYDPDYLNARKDAAARFTLGEGEIKTQDFRLPGQ